ncbi:MAG: hypothetical protein WAM62_11435 [Pseudolabrys sp.]
MILLATNERDITSDFVALELERRGLPFFRLNTETLSDAAVSFQPQLGERGWAIEYSPDKSLRFVDVRAGYLRRPEIPAIRLDVGDEVQRQYCSAEWGLSLLSALRSLGDRWLNSPISMLLAEDKPRQLALALRLGFEVPETLVTNDPEGAQKFVARGGCIGKPLSSSLFGTGDRERVVFTTRLALSDLENNPDIEVAPIILQREITKKSDLRVTVVGEKIFAAEIHSQSSTETEVDWRKGGAIDLLHSEHRLPELISEKCFQLTRMLGLKFSAIDLVLSDDNRYWFLEINPNGQWAWVEKRLGVRIAEAIVDELVEISKC